MKVGKKIKSITHGWGVISEIDEHGYTVRYKRSTIYYSYRRMERRAAVGMMILAGVAIFTYIMMTQ